jgi:hypothetical protein
MKKDNMIYISEAELCEYLMLLKNILKITDSQKDTKRLNDIIRSLTNKNYSIGSNIYDDEKNRELLMSKGVKTKYFDYHSQIRDVLLKIRNGEMVLIEDKELADEYIYSNHFIQLIDNKQYEKLFSQLSFDDNISKSDLTLIYIYLTGMSNRDLNKSQLLDEIKNYLFKIQNMEDMNKKYLGTN